MLEHISKSNMKLAGLRKKLTPIIIVNCLISLIIWGVILYLLPLQDKYTFNLVKKEPIQSRYTVVYEDVYNDGTSEKISFVKDYFGCASVFLHDGAKCPWQWNLNAEFCQGHFYCFEDVNNDNVKDIFVLTYRNDSVFLNLYDIGKQTERFKNLFIDTFDRINGKIDFYMRYPQLVDFRDDGNQQLLFVLNCAFSHTTRKLCLVDYNAQKVKLSPKAGSIFSTKPTLLDIDGDGKKEISGEHFSPGNTALTYPYTDQYAWLQLYDDNLQFKFPPVKTGHYPARQTILPVEKNNTTYLIGLFNHSGNTDTSYLALYSNSGHLLKKRNMEYPVGYTSSNLFLDNRYPGECLLTYNTGEIYRLNTDLKQTLTVTHPPTQYYYNWRYDLDGDGNDEMIFPTTTQSIKRIISSDYSYSLASDMVTGVMSVCHQKGEKPLLVVSANEKLVFYRYAKNPWYIFVWPIRISLLMMIMGILWLLSLVQRKYMLRRIESEKRLTALQVKALKNQITPHFTLNVLNSIGSLYASDKKEQADMALGKFAKLLRTALLSSDNVAVALKDEIFFVRNYLELEKIRLNGRLNYRFDIDESILQSTRIPKMMLHTFVENAIKHGIRHMDEKHKGLVEIKMISSKEWLIVNIEDNGIGLEKAAELTTNSTKQGLQILDEAFRLYKQLENRSIQYKIGNSTTHSSGTCVTIKLALN